MSDGMLREIQDYDLESARLHMSVVELAEGYVDALYSAKFARTMQVDERTIIQSQNKCITASRALVDGVGKLREHLKPKVVSE
jgi:hypothetical protein